jgi:hypothetical protein
VVAASSGESGKRISENDPPSPPTREWLNDSAVGGSRDLHLTGVLRRSQNA